MVEDTEGEGKKDYRTSEARRRAQKRYAESQKGKATSHRYRGTERHKLTQKLYNQSDKGKEAAKKRRDRNNAESED